MCELGSDIKWDRELRKYLFRDVYVSITHVLTLFHRCIVRLHANICIS